MEQYKINRNIICIDLKSFFASVECVLRGVDMFTTPLVVADESRGKGSIVLAVTPYLKSKGIPSRLRLFELPEGLETIIAKPRMQEYINYSAAVIEIYLEFISEDDLYIYSIDEAFLDVTAYLNYYGCSDVELAKRIMDKITKKLGLYATAGIGPNMLLAKVALDVDSKYAKDFISKWTYDDVEAKLWKISPISKMWGIGRQMEKHLNLLGLNKVGDIAKYNRLELKRRFGIIGEELYYHTHGIDMSLISEKIGVKRNRKSYGIGQVLFSDYPSEDFVLIIREMVDELSRRLRMAKKKCLTISLAIGYSKYDGGGFGRQVKLDQPTNNELIMFNACMDLFNTFYDKTSLIRRLQLSATNLSESNLYQYSMFEDADELDKLNDLSITVNEIKDRYGKNAINRASSELSHSTAKRRNKTIGGHNE